ncbi:MAG: hypothetical protein Q4A55_03100 [Aerococcus sp.]|nr:hypothetical protein [Aerococcus sp.]
MKKLKGLLTAFGVLLVIAIGLNVKLWMDSTNQADQINTLESQVKQETEKVDALTKEMTERRPTVM